MNHRALNLHYVNGYPMDPERPDAGEILLGRSNHWKPEVGVLHPPGTTFQYSGGGYLALEHLIECFEKKPIHEVTAPFLRLVSSEHAPLSFDEQGFQPEQDASGFRDDGSVIPGGRYRFPAFAAGAVGSAASTLRFYTRLESAYQGRTSPIERDTAIRMLTDKDPASQSFMGVQCGVGTFVAEALQNRFAIHQGANDGFRALSLHCYRGPDRGKGFVIFCNADDRGVQFIAKAAQILLQHLKIQGIDWSRIGSGRAVNGQAKEEIVNLGYRDLLFRAFLPDRAEEIVVKGKLDPLAAQSLTVGARILSVTNDRFARAENLFSPHEPVFDPELYGRQGKIMDSWESVRHNPLPGDILHFELKEASRISHIFFSTRYHLGNQAPKVRVEARIDPKHPWATLVPETPMEGHAMKRVLSKDPETLFREVRASMIPDGGFTRLYLYGAELPASEARHYQEVETSVCVPYLDPIPTPKKPLAPDYEVDPARLARNLDRISTGERIDIASIAFGGRVLSASNEHYSPASRMISPFPPLHMFDGLESARSRIPGHHEEARVKPGLPLPIEEIELDFHYFVNNNPVEIEIHGLVDGSWKVLLPRTRVKEYAGLRFLHRLQTPLVCAEIKLTVFPDGGVNRLKLWAKKA
jgi:allantoicase